LVSETIPLPLPSLAAYIRRSIAMTDGFSVNFKHDLFIRMATPILQLDYPMPKTQGIHSNVFTIAEGNPILNFIEERSLRKRDIRREARRILEVP